MAVAGPPLDRLTLSGPIRNQMPRITFPRPVLRLILIITVMPALASAQDITSDPPLEPLADETIEYEVEEPEEAPGLLGYALHGRGGVAVEYVYTGEVMNNMRGGLNTRKATEYRGNFDLTVTTDLDRLGFFPGGTFFIYGQNRTTSFVQAERVVSFAASDIQQTAGLYVFLNIL